jgi:hypothetical protein
MKRSTAAVGLVLGLLATACSSGNGTNPGTCSLTVTGGLTVSGSCTAAAAVTGNTNGKVAFAVAANPSGSIISLLVTLDQTSLQTGTYGSASGTNVVSAGSEVFGSNGDEWAQFFNEPPVPDQGSFTLTISSTGSEVQSGADATWPDPDGSLTVVLAPQPASGATGTVTVQVTF